MRRWIIRQENAVGEWTVIDMQNGYRICAFNEEAHGGVHVHFPLRGPALKTVDVPDPRAAEAIMTRYAKTHDGFSMASFLAEVKRWRSASNDT